MCAYTWIVCKNRFYALYLLVNAFYRTFLILAQCVCKSLPLLLASSLLPFHFSHGNSSSNI